jgi:hypothetical protein
VGTASIERTVRRRRRWRIARNTFFLLVLGAAVAAAIAFQRAYGTWPGLDVNNRINWCHKVYRVAVTDLTLAEVNTDPAHPVEPLFRYPPHLPRRDVLGVPTAGSPATCPGALFIRVGSDRYTRYLPIGG